LSYEEKLSEASYAEQKSSKERATFFAVMPTGRTGGKMHKKKYTKFHWNIRKQFFPVGVAEHHWYYL